MRRKVVWQQDAQNEILGHYEYLRLNADPGTAGRFLGSVRQAAKQLLAMPQLGVQRRLPGLASVETRMWPVPRFGKYLLFYHPAPEGIVVLRVIHSSTDWMNYLD